MGDSPRLFDVNVKVNYLGLKLKHVRNGYPLRENLSIVSCLGGNYNAAKPRAQPCFDRQSICCRWPVLLL